jgi:hypothetical protein
MGAGLRPMYQGRCATRIVMKKAIGDREGRYKQVKTPDLCDQYRDIGISAISAAALCQGRKSKTQPQVKSQSHPSGQFYEFED